MRVKPEVFIDRRKPGFWSIEARPWAVVSIVVAAFVSFASNVREWQRSDATQVANLSDMKESREQAMAARDREIDALRDDMRDVRTELRSMDARHSREHPCEK